MFYLKELPNWYVTKEIAQYSGWNRKNNLEDVLPGKMIGGNIFWNRSMKLPDDGERIWYEADIDYDGSYRNSRRILYPNDGLMFVTFDHYQTFYEVIWQEK